MFIRESQRIHRLTFHEPLANTRLSLTSTFSFSSSSLSARGHIPAPTHKLSFREYFESSGLDQNVNQKWDTFKQQEDNNQQDRQDNNAQTHQE